MRKSKALLDLAPLLLIAAQNAITIGAPGQFVSPDTYSRYELLAPETHQFKLYYEVIETRTGAKFHFNATIVVHC